jgi:hypothetical protein
MANRKWTNGRVTLIEVPIGASGFKLGDLSDDRLNYVVGGKRTYTNFPIRSGRIVCEYPNCLDELMDSDTVKSMGVNVDDKGSEDYVDITKNKLLVIKEVDGKIVLVDYGS